MSRAASARVPDGVRLGALETPDDCIRAAALVAAAWGLAPSESPLAPDVVRALAYSGNHVGGAWIGDDLVGLAAGFWGRHGDLPVLHSHVACVRPGLEGRGIGAAMKFAQREFVLAAGVHHIAWTFDPLVARNAYFNLTVLGAAAVEYHVSFYGAMDDELNRGDESDRLVALWDLVAEPAPESRRGDADPGDDPGAGTDADDGTGTIRFRVPDDIVALRRHDPEQALRWRFDLRACFVPAYEQGYRATAMSRDGWYSLTRVRP